MGYYPSISTLSDTGIWVEQFQDYLTRAGYPVQITGKYDTVTKAAVKKFVEDLQVDYTSYGGAVTINDVVWSALISYTRALEKDDIATAMSIPDQTSNQSVEMSDVTLKQSYITYDDKKSTLIKIGLIIGAGYFILSSVFGKRG